MNNPNIAEAGKKTQFPHNDPTKGGRKPSIKRELEKLAISDGTLKFKAKDCKVHKDGSVSINMPKQDAMAMKLFQWAMSNKGSDSIKAIQMIMEHFDGKPHQTTEEKGDPRKTVVKFNVKR